MDLNLWFVLAVVQLLTGVWLFVVSVDCSTPDYPVLHCLPKFAQVDAILSSRLLPSSSPFAFTLIKSIKLVI